MLKANMRSLKLASQAMKKAVKPPRCMVWRWRGRFKKTAIMGRRESNLGKPLGMFLVIKKE